MVKNSELDTDGISVLACLSERCARFARDYVAVLVLAGSFVPTQVTAASNDSGFTPYGTLSVDLFANTSGGITTGSSVFALLDIGIEADLQRVLGWNGTSMHLGTLWGEGDDPSADVGDFNALSNIVMPEGGRLFEWYIEKTYEKNDLRIKAGLIGVDGDFQASEYSAGFINSGFGVVPTLSGNMPSPIFPQAALGVVMQYSMSESEYLQLGVFDGDAGSDEHGTDIDLDSKQGSTIVLEYADAILNGDYKVGVIYHTGEFVDLITGLPVDGNSSLYFVSDQVLAVDESGRSDLAGFVRLGVSPKEEINTVRSYIEFGVNLFDPFDRNGNDLAGIGFLYTDFSEDFIASERSAGGFVNEQESVLEIFYQMEIAESLMIKPDVQMIIDPISSDDATVVGVRLEASF